MIKGILSNKTDTYVAS